MGWGYSGLIEANIGKLLGVLDSDPAPFCPWILTESRGAGRRIGEVPRSLTWLAALNVAVYTYLEDQYTYDEHALRSENPTARGDFPRLSVGLS